MLITITKTELLDLLEINNDRYKYLVKTNQLEEKLTLKGYKIKTKYKKGRNTIFELILIETDEIKIHQDKRSIRKKDEYIEYVKERLSDGLNKTRVDIVKTIKDKKGLFVSESSAGRYDDILVEEGLLIEIPIEDKGIMMKGKKIFNCVYKWINEENEIVYIGKTKNLKNRTYSHIKFKDDELHKKWFKDNLRIEYVSFNEYGDCGVVEQYLIMKHKPIGNTEFVLENISMSISEIDNLKWNTYKYSYSYEKDYIKNCRYEITKKGKEFLSLLI